MKFDLLSIIGTTATGKTDLAFQLATNLIQQELAKGVIIIGADSRQVYTGLETITGADIPQNFFTVDPSNQNSYRYFQHPNLPIQLHGVSIIKVTQDWSVAQFAKMASNLIKQAMQKNYFSIVVGGTGFYHQQLLTTQPSLQIKPNEKIRKQAEKKTVAQLQKWLKKLNTQKFEALNQSDINNPRRLVRAIEIEIETQQEKISDQKKSTYRTLQIGLKIDQAQLEEKIKKRVEDRLKNGAITEVENLLSLNLSPQATAITATGVNSIRKSLSQEISNKQLLDEWILEETQYAKRQLTWFKKYEPDLWLNCKETSNQTTIINLIS